MLGLCHRPVATVPLLWQIPHPLHHSSPLPPVAIVLNMLSPPFPPSRHHALATPLPYPHDHTLTPTPTFLINLLVARRQVAVPRTSGRHTVSRVVEAWPGWVRVEVGPGASKDVPEDQVCRLLGGLRLASADSLLWAQDSATRGGPALGVGLAPAPSSGRTVVLGQDAGGLPAEAGLTHSDYRAGELVGEAAHTAHTTRPTSRPHCLH